MMLIVCSHCGECLGCVDEKTNKTEKCSKCSDAEFCQDRYDFTGKVLQCVCSQCIAQRPDLVYA